MTMTLLLCLVLSIVAGTLATLYQWCQFRPSGSHIFSNTSAWINIGTPSSFSRFVVGETTCQIWSLNFTVTNKLDEFLRGTQANWNALKNEWVEKENFRFMVVAYANVFFLIVAFIYFLIDNYNQFNKGQKKLLKEKRNRKNKKRKPVNETNYSISFQRLQASAEPMESEEIAGVEQV